MTDLIPRDAAIAAIEKWWNEPQSTAQTPMTILRAIPTIDPAAIREAIERAWCHEENVAKEMDVDLAEAVLFQILTLIGEKK